MKGHEFPFSFLCYTTELMFVSLFPLFSVSSILLFVFNIFLPFVITHLFQVHTYKYIHLHHMFPSFLNPHLSLSLSCSLIHTCTYTHLHTHMHASKHAHTHMHTEECTSKCEPLRHKYPGLPDTIHISMQTGKQKMEQKHSQQN